jgi:mono/diheme cytochrome c family protein
VRRTRSLVALSLLALGCRQDMHDQPRYKPYAGSAFFGDGRSARPLLPGTVARGHLRDDEHLYTGRSGAALAEELPFPVTEDVLRRGRERYEIFCTPCHGQTGGGDGMIVRRGYRRPASFHVDRLRGEPVGYLFDVMTRGFGAMPDYASQIEPKDRWAIAAYVRVLHLSQHAAAKDLPADLVQRIGAGAPPPAGGAQR